MVRINNKRTRRTQTQILQDEFNRMLNISTDLYSTKHKDLINNIFNIGLNVYQSKQKENENSIFNIGTDVYQSKQKENSIMNVGTDLYTTKKKNNNSIFNVGTDVYKTKKKKSNKHSEENKQLGIANSAIKKHTPLIEFDLTKMKDREYFFDELPDVLYDLLDSIELDNDKWVIHYDYGSGWKGKPLDSISEKILRDQIENELERANYDYQFDEHDYDLFPYGIRSLKRLTIVNYSKVKQYKLQRDLKKLGIIISTDDKQKAKRNKREGRFWKWYLNFKEIDLSRFMIFHKLNKEEVHIIERDNCFIYACAMAGLDSKILDDLRYNIQKRSIATSDITRAAKECDLKIKVKLENGQSYYVGNGSHEIKLLLMNHHYMVNERVKVSPYYIKHRDEINSDRNTKYWKLEERMKIEGKYNGHYLKGKDFSLRKVILALFEVNAFTPISTGDYMTFNSLICFEKIDPIKNLEYDERFCTRLKQPWKEYDKTYAK